MTQKLALKVTDVLIHPGNRCPDIRQLGIRAGLPQRKRYACHPLWYSPHHQQICSLCLETMSIAERQDREPPQYPSYYGHASAEGRNDINMVSYWLGHADINTTHVYIEIDMEMKRKMLLKAAASLDNKTLPWQKPEMLRWLEALQKSPQLCAEKRCSEAMNKGYSDMSST